MISRYKQLHTSWVASSTDQKLTGSQRLTYRSESSEPHTKPSRVGIQHWEKESLEHLALKASGACVQELHRTGGNGDPILKRRTQTFTCTGSQGRERSPQEPRSNLTAVLGGHHGKTGVNVACCEGRTLKAKPFSGGGHFGKIWPHPSALRSPRANNNPGGITAPPLSKQAT